MFQPKEKTHRYTTYIIFSQNTNSLLIQISPYKPYIYSHLKAYINIKNINACIKCMTYTIQLHSFILFHSNLYAWQTTYIVDYIQTVFPMQ